MVEVIDEHFVASVRGSRPVGGGGDEPELVLALFDAQLQSRHLDLAARWLQAQGEGFYTIGSAGHEANAAVGLLTRVDDPALLHYRSGGFYAARAGPQRARAPETHTPVRDVLLGLALGRGRPDLRRPAQGLRPPGAAHRPADLDHRLAPAARGRPGLRAGQPRRPGAERRWPEDAIVVASLGDASVNHSTAQGALNAAAYLTHRGLDLPLLSSSRTTASASAPVRRRAGWRSRCGGCPASGTSRRPRRARTGCSPTSAPRSTTSGTAPSGPAAPADRALPRPRRLRRRARLPHQHRDRARPRAGPAARDRGVPRRDRDA